MATTAELNAAERSRIEGRSTSAGTNGAGSSGNGGSSSGGTGMSEINRVGQVTGQFQRDVTAAGGVQGVREAQGSGQSAFGQSSPGSSAPGFRAGDQSLGGLLTALKQSGQFVDDGLITFLGFNWGSVDGVPTLGWSPSRLATDVLGMATGIPVGLATGALDMAGADVMPDDWQNLGEVDLGMDTGIGDALSGSAQGGGGLLSGIGGSSGTSNGSGTSSGNQGGRETEGPAWRGSQTENRGIGTPSKLFTVPAQVAPAGPTPPQTVVTGGLGPRGPGGAGAGTGTVTGANPSSQGPVAPPPTTTTTTPGTPGGTPTSGADAQKLMSAQNAALQALYASLMEPYMKPGLLSNEAFAAKQREVSEQAYAAVARATPAQLLAWYDRQQAARNGSSGFGARGFTSQAA